MNAPGARRAAVVTGTRAEFGLLLPVIRSLRAAPEFEVAVVAAGTHLLPPSRTIEEVRRCVGADATVEMQHPGQTGRLADAAALGRGIEGFARVFADLRPDWVVVLGDRIEAFAAGAAACVGGIAVAHIHGGDRAEGIADEALRHSLTKLAHLHLAATPASAERIIRMGEPPEFVHVVGSPAIDGLADIAPMSDTQAHELGDPLCVLLMHPSGLAGEDERLLIRTALAAATVGTGGAGALCLAPNPDPGREIILEEIARAARERGWPLIDHLPRERFVALLKRLAAHPRGLLIGNSSSGLIEAAALRLPAVNVGPRQAGRERPDNVIDVEGNGEAAARAAVGRALGLRRHAISHPYGDGRAGPRIRSILAGADPHRPGMLRKRCEY